MTKRLSVLAFAAALAAPLLAAAAAPPAQALATQRPARRPAPSLMIVGVAHFDNPSRDVVNCG